MFLKKSDINKLKKDDRITIKLIDTLPPVEHIVFVVVSNSDEEIRMKTLFQEKDDIVIIKKIDEHGNHLINDQGQCTEPDCEENFYIKSIG